MVFNNLNTFNNVANPNAKTVETVTQDEHFREVSTLNDKIRELEQLLQAEQQKNSKQKEDVVEFLREWEPMGASIAHLIKALK